jgi:hypothetical protein
MNARLSTAALLALGMLIGGCMDEPPPVPVSRKATGHPRIESRQSDDVTNRLSEAQFEQARVLEVSASETSAGAAWLTP